MNAPDDNENWLIDAGFVVIRKKADVGFAALSPKERLTYCLWVADYGMRNAGDLDTVRDLHATFQQEAASLAVDLRLPFVHETFSLKKSTFQEKYFERFERVCDELKNA